ncbi:MULTISPECIES: GFA family protein [Photobacterium]|uniref:GFA family protein n=1 Tax=Photobacterium TaxID=657 RepID=UPI0003FD836F|nr:GFA family protein [Photobacterium halotolerans]
MRKLHGACLCGAVTFSLDDDFSHFYLCHCDQCKKLTGSAHASNLFTQPHNIRWEQGEQAIVRYNHPTRTFSNAFCGQCGANLPYLSQSGKALIVPAGSLNELPSKSPDCQIFCDEQAPWHQAGMLTKHLPGFPE